MSHYHIRCSGKAEFDWERYGSRGDAEECAELLGRGETYSVDEVHDESCPRYHATLKIANGDGAVTASLKDSWQETVSDAFAEIRPEFGLWKVNVAQRAVPRGYVTRGLRIAKKRVAIREALRVSKHYFPEETNRRREKTCFTTR